jgi:hypothetical protein
MDAMADGETTGHDDRSIGEWLSFWVQMFGLGLLALLGAIFAGTSGAPGDEDCGLILAIAAVLLVFLRLKHAFDGGPAGWQEFLFVDTIANLAIVIPLFVVLGLAGLFLAAAWGAGSLHDAGLGLFVASGLVIFFSLKRVFDALDRHRDG